MKPTFLSLLLLASCSHFHRPSERTVSQIEDREMSIYFDWNEDGALDKATLEPAKPGEFGEEFHEFSITLSAVGGPKQVVGNDLFVEANKNPGAYLKLLPNGDIEIILDQTGIGASASVTVWTVAYITDRFLLKKYAYTFEDRVEHHKRGDCEMNLLDGEGKRNGSSIKFKPIEEEINRVDVNFQPKSCKLRFRP